MVRRLRGHEKPLFVELLNEGGFYPELDPLDFQGVSCYGAFDGSGQLVGGGMVIVEARHAYLDYLFVAASHRNEGYGVRLLDVMRDDLREQGVRYVYASISGENELSGKLAARHHGRVGFPFMHVRIELEERDGQQ